MSESDHDTMLVQCGGSISGLVLQSKRGVLCVYVYVCVCVSVCEWVGGWKPSGTQGEVRPEMCSIAPRHANRASPPDREWVFSRRLCAVHNHTISDACVDIVITFKSSLWPECIMLT